MIANIQQKLQKIKVIYFKKQDIDHQTGQDKNDKYTEQNVLMYLIS